MSISFEPTKAEEPLYKKSDCRTRCTYLLNDEAEVALTPKSLEKITAALASNIKKESDNKYSSQVTINGETISLEYEKVK